MNALMDKAAASRLMPPMSTSSVDPRAGAGSSAGSDAGFRANSSSDPVTKGADVVLGLPDALPGGACLALLDTEGQGEAGDDHDTRVAVPSLLASTVTIFNTMVKGRAGRADILKELSTLVAATRLVLADSGTTASEDGPVTFGHLVIVLRDYQLDDWSPERHYRGIFEARGGGGGKGAASTADLDATAQQVQEAFASITVLPFAPYGAGAHVPAAAVGKPTFDACLEDLWRRLQGMLVGGAAGKRHWLQQEAGITGPQLVVTTKAVANSLNTTGIVLLPDVHIALARHAMQALLQAQHDDIAGNNWERVDNSMEIATHGLVGILAARLLPQSLDMSGLERIAGAVGATDELETSRKVFVGRLVDAAERVLTAAHRRMEASARDAVHTAANTLQATFAPLGKLTPAKRAPLVSAAESTFQAAIAAAVAPLGQAVPLQPSTGVPGISNDILARLQDSLPESSRCVKPTIAATVRKDAVAALTAVHATLQADAAASAKVAVAAIADEVLRDVHGAVKAARAELVRMGEDGATTLDALRTASSAQVRVVQAACTAASSTITVASSEWGLPADNEHVTRIADRTAAAVSDVHAAGDAAVSTASARLAEEERRKAAEAKRAAEEEAAAARSRIERAEREAADARRRAAEEARLREEEDRRRRAVEEEHYRQLERAREEARLAAAEARRVEAAMLASVASSVPAAPSWGGGLSYGGGGGGYSSSSSSSSGGGGGGGGGGESKFYKGGQFMPGESTGKCDCSVACLM